MWEIYLKNKEYLNGRFRVYLSENEAKLKDRSEKMYKYLSEKMDENKVEISKEWGLVLCGYMFIEALLLQYQEMKKK